MSLISNVLLLVTSLLDDKKEVVLDGYDFPRMLSLRFQGPPNKVFAVSPHGTTLIVDPALQFVHLCNRGWMWRTAARDLYPAPPFLLTSDEAYRFIYEGPVVTHPGDAAACVRSMQAEYGTFQVPVLTPDWIGELTIESDSAERGHLLAFSNRIDRLPIRCDEVRMPEWDEKFGAVTLRP